MSDIVERLRSPEVFIDAGGMTSPVALLAADEIERLRQDREMLRGERDSARAMAEDIWLDMQKDMSSLELTIAWLQDEREELRAALRDCVETWRPLLADADLTAHENPAYLTLMRADQVLEKGADA